MMRLVAKQRKDLEALAVHNGGARLVVLLLGDPHLLEGRQGRKDGASNPDRVLTLGGSNNLDLHGGGGEGGQLLLHAVSDAREHRGATRQDGVAVEILTDIDVTLHDRVVGGLVDTGGFHAEEGRLEHGLGAAESLVADGDDLSVRKLVRLLEGRGGGSGLHLLLKVEGDVGELLLDVTDDFTLGRGGEGVTTLGQDLHHVVGEIATGKVETEDSVGKRITLIDGDGMGHTITRVHDDTGGTARGVQGKHSLDGDVHGGGVEGLKHDLSHLLTVSLGVEGGLGQKDRVLLRGHTQLVVEGVVPDLLHVVPVGHDTVLNGVLQGEDTTLGLGLVTDVRVLLAHADHDTSVTGAADDGGKDGAGSVVTGEAGLAHAGAVVNNESLDFFFHCINFVFSFVVVLLKGG
mmetsp:Transcript_19222/g.32755  ORF Transcript_19222/g.32755 Transcript_19222/m.32755 type:complete len:404 (+) Transcript_19222:86-1297(+)